MSAKGGSKKDLLQVIRGLQHDNQRLWDALNEVCDWIETESGQHPSNYDNDTTPANAWRILTGHTPWPTLRRRNYELGTGRKESAGI